MHQRFGRDEDGQIARERYLQLVDLYPGNTLADDALFEAAGLKAPDATAPEALYQQILPSTPQGDQAVNAKKAVTSIRSTPGSALGNGQASPPLRRKQVSPSSVTPPKTPVTATHQRTCGLRQNFTC